MSSRIRLVSSSYPREMPSRILEITLISAQDLVQVSKNMNTYAVIWIQHESNNTDNNNNKQATNVDRTGETCPTWNVKFTFQIDDKFLTSEVAKVFVEVYAASRDNDTLIGSVKILVKDIANATGTLALEICPPSGRSQGILNIQVAKYLTMEDKGSGSMVNGSSICNSDVGPSISVVAAAIAEGLYNPPVHNQNHQSKEATEIKEWTKKERAKEVGGHPPGSIVAVPYQSGKQKTSKGKKNEGTKLFSCLGCEISVTCGGEDGKKIK